MSGWGKGSENNNIGWGQGAYSATNGWGESQKVSYAGDTDILGDPALGISYSASAFCENASNPTPTVSGNEGSGTFSSTTGLVFVSTSTGEVNISSSTAGATYLITYTDTNAATATFSLTINNLDNAAFAYSASSYEPTGSDPTPTITGLTGGTFSAGSGLVFVDSGTNTGSSTGQIDLSATTIASYTITYDTTSSGSSVCPNTSTQTVELALSGISNVYSMSFDGTDYLKLPTSLDLGTVNTISAWYYKTNTAAVTLVGEDSYANDYTIWLTSSQVYYRVNNKYAYWNYTIPQNDWINLVITRNGNTAKLYVNGSEQTLSGNTGIGTVNSTKFDTIGNKPNGSNGFVGNIDEFAAWNTALTSTQVSEIYSATSNNLTKDLSTVSGSNLKLWLRMGD